jgi:hypothetical protein
VAKFDPDRPQKLADDYPCGAITASRTWRSLPHWAGYIGYRISRCGEDKRSVKVKVLPSLTGPAVETEMTHKDYDMSELKKLLKSFSVVIFCICLCY